MGGGGWGRLELSVGRSDYCNRECTTPLIHSSATLDPHTSKLITTMTTTYLWLARNEGMNPCSSPYITLIVASIQFSVPSFPASQG